jgi:hypothetical protein
VRVRRGRQRRLALGRQRRHPEARAQVRQRDAEDIEVRKRERVELEERNRNVQVRHLVRQPLVAVPRVPVGARAEQQARQQRGRPAEGAARSEEGGQRARGQRLDARVQRAVRRPAGDDGGQEPGVQLQAVLHPLGHPGLQQQRLRQQRARLLQRPARERK